MRKLIDPSDPGQCFYAAEWDVITLEEFQRRHLWTSGRKNVVFLRKILL